MSQSVRFRPADKNELILWIHKFYGGDRTKGPIGNWDVSHITDMSNLFCHKTTFNDPLNNWDVSNVTDMSGMFNSCTNFNQPLDTWNVSNVTNMMFMFLNCTNFNQPLDTWNVSNVTNMFCMFKNCTNFNQPLNTWNVSNVTNMNGMFTGCTSFRQTLRPWFINDSINWKKISDQPFILTEIARYIYVKENTDKVFEKLTSLDTFNLKNSELGQNTLPNGLIKENIKSYLKKIRWKK